MKKTITIMVLSVSLVIGLVWYHSMASQSAREYNYEEFADIVACFQRDFRVGGYTKLSPSHFLSSSFRAFAPNLLIEKRANDAVDGDLSKPSRFEFYFLKEDTSTLLIVTLFFYESAQNGIILQTITSPADNVYLDDAYVGLARPYTIDTVMGYKGHSLFMKTILLKPKPELSAAENILALIKEDTALYRALEEFLIKLRP